VKKREIYIESFMEEFGGGRKRKETRETKDGHPPIPLFRSAKRFDGQPAHGILTHWERKMGLGG